MRSWYDVLCFCEVMAVLLAVVVLMSFGASLVVYRAICPGELAEVESLRADARLVGGCEAEAVAGQVAEMNRLIAVRQEYRGHWWSRLAVPSSWDAVEPIAMPEGVR